MSRESLEAQVTPLSLRKRAGLTQRKLSIAVDVRRETISDWERGVSKPHLPPSKWLLFMRALNCTMEELIEAYEGEEVLQALNLNTSKNNGNNP